MWFSEIRILKMWFSEIRILKHTFGFQNTHTDFKTQIRFLILLFCLFQNSQHIDDTVKHTFGFQNTHTDFKTHTRVLILMF